jgi:pyruvate-formate lyase-activating enzyme
MPRVKPPCRPNCPRRCPGCHNPDTCRAWRDYCEKKAEYDATIRAVRGKEVLMYNYHVRVLQDYNRRRNAQCNGRKL